MSTEPTRLVLWLCPPLQRDIHPAEELPWSSHPVGPDNRYQIRVVEYIFSDYERTDIFIDGICHIEIQNELIAQLDRVIG